MKKPRKNFAIAVAVAAMAAAGLQMSAAPAQPRSDRAPPTGPGEPAEPVAPGPRGPVVTVPCCRCVDGKPLTVNIGTRSAPWTVQGPSGGAFQPVVVAANTAWTGALAPAGWVAPPGATGAAASYTYVLRLRLPRCLIPARVEFSGEFAADNHATVYLDNALHPTNSNYVIGHSPAGSFGFQTPNIRTFADTLAPGINTLRIVVRNDGGATGLAVRGAITIRCPLQRRDPEPVEADPVPVDDR